MQSKLSRFFVTAKVDKIDENLQAKDSFIQSEKKDYKEYNFDVMPNTEREMTFVNQINKVFGKPKSDTAISSFVQSNYTPLEKQVVALKAANTGSILMVECGYRFRFFGDDAVVASRCLGIYSHMDHNFLVASVPTFRVAVHLRRLVTAGYKV
jgi:hypothetical protein